MGGEGDPSRAIKVKMLMFGPLAEKMGTREIDVSLVEGTSVNDLAMQFELVEMISSGLRVAVDGHLETDLTRLLHDAAEVAFLPPVSGGCPFKMPKHLKKALTQRSDSMALGSTEIVILVVFGIFLFGANKIPQLARGVGRAKGEFHMGMKEASEMAAIEDMDRGGRTEDVSSEQE